MYLIKSLDDFSSFSECGKLCLPQELTRTFHLTSLKIHTKSSNTMTGVKVSKKLLFLLLSMITASITEKNRKANIIIKILTYMPTEDP